MSFVGTRPEAVKYVEKYKPEYMATLLLPAGITSEASIRYILLGMTILIFVLLALRNNFKIVVKIDSFSSFPLPFAILQKTVRVNTVQLLDCIEQMIKYRFEITMTEKCLRYIIDEYSKLENQELKEDFMCKWIDCLTLAESKGDEYKEVYAQNMMRVCQDIIREEYEVLNPVWRNYFSLCVKYKCGLETK